MSSISLCISCSAMLLASSTPALAAEPTAPAPAARPERLNAVQLDLGLAVVGLAYERVVERRLALQIEGHIFGTWFGPIVDLPNLSGFGGQLRPSFFLTDDAPRGVYVAPYLRVNRVTAESNGAEDTGIGFSTGGFVGYSFLFADRINLRLGGGLQYMSYAVDVQRRAVTFQTIFPALDLLVGFVF